MLAKALWGVKGGVTADTAEFSPWKFGELRDGTRRVRTRARGGLAGQEALTGMVGWVTWRGLTAPGHQSQVAEAESSRCGFRLAAQTSPHWARSPHDVLSPTPLEARGARSRAPFALVIALWGWSRAAAKTSTSAASATWTSRTPAPSTTGTTATINSRPSSVRRGSASSPPPTRTPTRPRSAPPRARPTTTAPTARPRRDQASPQCKTGFTCMVATTVGKFCCERLCVCRDFIDTTRTGFSATAPGRADLCPTSTEALLATSATVARFARFAEGASPLPRALPLLRKVSRASEAGPPWAWTRSLRSL